MLISNTYMLTNKIIIKVNVPYRPAPGKGAIRVKLYGSEVGAS